MIIAFACGQAQTWPILQTSAAAWSEASAGTFPNGNSAAGAERSGEDAQRLDSLPTLNLILRRLLTPRHQGKDFHRLLLIIHRKSSLYPIYGEI